MNKSIFNVEYPRPISVTKLMPSNQRSCNLSEVEDSQSLSEQRQIRILRCIADALLKVAMHATAEGASFVSLAKAREQQISRTAAVALRDKTVMFAIAKTKRKKSERAF